MIKMTNLGEARTVRELKKVFLYSEIEEAVKALKYGKYTMSMVGGDAEAVRNAVNQGIDAYLEACFIPSKGDEYKQVGHRLDCIVSPSSMATLIRRLLEGNEDAELLACNILDTLGFGDDLYPGNFIIIAKSDEAAFLLDGSSVAS